MYTVYTLLTADNTPISCETQRCDLVAVTGEFGNRGTEPWRGSTCGTSQPTFRPDPRRRRRVYVCTRRRSEGGKRSALRDIRLGKPPTGTRAASDKNGRHHGPDC